MPETSHAPTSAPTIDLAAMLAESMAERDALRAERDNFRRLYLDLLAVCRKLELGIMGRGRERDLGDPKDIALPLLAMLTDGAVQPAPPANEGSDDAGQDSGEQEPDPKPRRPKPPGRKPLPENLPRVDVEVLPPEVQKAGLDAFERIGEDVTETLERRPSSMVVVRVHKPKFVAKGRDLEQAVSVLQAPAPELPIERGLAGPGLLADTIVRRWADHLPLHRLERIYGREGLELPRSTVGGWHETLAKLAKPLVDAMLKDALAAPYLCVDATGVLVQDNKKCRTGHFFVVAAPERHVLFGFSPKHNAAAVDKLLRDYQGVLVADAHAVYDHLFEDGKILEAGCWAHVRRYYFKALSSEPTRARHGLEQIRKLFEVERRVRSRPPEERHAARQRDSKPILDAFEAWCDLESTRVLDETPISKAIGYTRNHRVALRRFLDDGRLPIHNNWSERELRREALGRKNWLFLGSDEGGEVNATFVSLIASCQLHGIDPAGYLRDLLCLLPGWKAPRVLDLAPVNWGATSTRDDVRLALESNIYRRASLGR